MDTNSADMPTTLLEAAAFFSQGDNAHEFMVALRWPNGVTCPRCGTDKVCAIPTRKTWECKCCTEKKQFSAKTRTIFEESPIPLSKWLATVWLIANAKNGISSYEVHRAIGVSQKSAWFVLHRIRRAMQTGSFEKLQGDVEVDETYIGGRARFMHKSRNKRRGHGTGYVGKAIVMGLLERDGTVIAKHLPGNHRKVLHGEIKANVEPGSTVHTDALPSYEKMPAEFIHKAIDHAIAYVQGNVHTNGLENFWSLLKRTLKGTYVSVDAEHLTRYLDEQVFRFNQRKLDDAARFVLVLLQTVGKRLTYEELTNNPANP